MRRYQADSLKTAEEEAQVAKEEWVVDATHLPATKKMYKLLS
jgi:hypothetical protein